MRIRDLWESPALKATVVFGTSGVAFAGGNLLLARALPAPRYALVALAVALVQLSVPLAPAGLDGVVNRRKRAPRSGLFARVLLSSSVVAVAAAAAGGLFYRLEPALMAMLLACTLAGGLNLVAGARYQSLGRFPRALGITQTPNYSLALAGVLAVALGLRQPWFPCAVLAAGYALPAAFGWTTLARQGLLGDPAGDRLRWVEGFAIAGLSAAVVLLIQLERLLIPRLLTLPDLATFAVLSAIAGSPYRMLQMGVGYTMLPRLRAAATAGERRRLLAREGTVAALVVIVASLVVWFVTPLVVRWFLAGRYDLPRALILAALVTGGFKVASAFAASVNVALGSTTQLGLLNASSWGAIAIAVAAAAVGARWGLTGVVYGVGLGWLTHAVAAACLALPHLGDAPARAAPEPPPLPSAEM